MKLSKMLKNNANCSTCRPGKISESNNCCSWTSWLDPRRATALLSRSRTQKVWKKLQSVAKMWKRSSLSSRENCRKCLIPRTTRSALHQGLCLCCLCQVNCVLLWLLLGLVMLIMCLNIPSKNLFLLWWCYIVIVLSEIFTYTNFPYTYKSGKYEIQMFLKIQFHFVESTILIFCLPFLDICHFWCIVYISTLQLMPLKRVSQRLCWQIPVFPLALCCLKSHTTDFKVTQQEKWQLFISHVSHRTFCTVRSPKNLQSLRRDV